jgi:hypothetical protein
MFEQTRVVAEDSAEMQATLLSPTATEDGDPGFRASRGCHAGKDDDGSRGSTGMTASSAGRTSAIG